MIMFPIPKGEKIAKSNETTTKVESFARARTQKTAEANKTKKHNKQLRCSPSRRIELKIFLFGVFSMAKT